PGVASAEDRTLEYLEEVAVQTVKQLAAKKLKIDRKRPLQERKLSHVGTLLANCPGPRDPRLGPFTIKSTHSLFPLATNRTSSRSTKDQICPRQGPGQSSNRGEQVCQRTLPGAVEDYRRCGQCSIEVPCRGIRPRGSSLCRVDPNLGVEGTDWTVSW